MTVDSADFDLVVTNQTDDKNNVVNSEAKIGLQILTSDTDPDKSTVALQSETLVFAEATDADGNVATSVNLVWGSF